MELNHCRDHGALIAIVAIDELLTDTPSALAERITERQFLDKFVQMLLRHSAIEPELAPNGAVHGQRNADVLAIQRHGQLGPESA